MYRQILLDPLQTCLQKILWRNDHTDNVEEYELLTLTYGANTIEEARAIRDEVIQLLKEGGFELGKWASNNMELLEGINNQNDQPIDIHGDIESCILGTKWDRHEDAFFFCCKEASANKITKRHIIWDTAKLYDPLGLLGPVIVIAKLIVQELWQSEVQWDDMDTQSMQIHGFCDASQNAYGVCIYVRTRTGPHEYRSELLCSRSRVAPLKAVSLPRLELCAALLLARLIAKVREALDHLKVFLWSDSTIALNWITSPSRRWSTFVANRVGEVQRITEIEHWHHVSSSDNSADILSRGLNPNELINSAQWWHGPSFLQRDDDQWPDSFVVRLQHEIPEQRKIVSTVATVDDCIVSELINRHSRIDKVSRIIAYCLRFFKAWCPGTPAISVAPAELSHALSVICRIVQRQSFDKEYKALQAGGTIVSPSRLLLLAPFLDKKGLLRVGGRLSQSNLEYEARHPILLPRGHMLTKLIIKQEHRRTLHSGAQATMASVRQRARPRQSEAVMGSLPAERVTPSKPFSHCGVDYAGPAFIKDGKRRNAQLRVRRQLKELYEFCNSQQSKSDIQQFLHNQEILWNFIPPNAPHVGGLWEAAVKSAKHHLTRIVGRAHLTFEELQTLRDRSSSKLASYYPPKWSVEYLHSLQERTKWRSNKGLQLQPGQLVLVKQQNLAPLQWETGRIQEIHPGPDGITRVATVRTARGNFVRPLSKLAILPLEVAEKIQSSIAANVRDIFKEINLPKKKVRAKAQIQAQVRGNLKVLVVMM
ncbi:PREDICTED: uncharacterized protein LOC108781544 [Cyphomyrmex costatus]|uniref:uncharacterized protein LOC108781544 n=1 Tax=Cyphomyrmex costatus TaxID=456900 RepID=UPI00085238B2|nr:PREDICTED: uncharacterized protein LOC108781544 [Cyphomyrmex costatus]